MDTPCVQDSVTKLGDAYNRDNKISVPAQISVTIVVIYGMNDEWKCLQYAF
jgi:hypothetical protein